LGRNRSKPKVEECRYFMRKNKRNQEDNNKREELEELEDQENELEKGENASAERDEQGEQLDFGEPWSGRQVNAEDAPTAHVQGDWENHEEFPLSDDIVSDFVEVGTDPDAVQEEMQQYTLDIDVQEDFEERQNLATSKDSMEEDLGEITHQSPKLSGGDVDAAWEYSDQSGEESVGASVPTPDQDVVDELGEAFGVTYDDDEELDTAEKLGERDLNRWELNPASARDMEAGNVVDGSEDPLSLIEEEIDEEMDLEAIENELDELLDEEDLDELEDELREADLDPLDLEDEDLEDIGEDDLELFEDDEFDELEDEDIL
jgi:hypothetical protein